MSGMAGGLGTVAPPRPAQAVMTSIVPASSPRHTFSRVVCMQYSNHDVYAFVTAAARATSAHAGNTQDARLNAGVQLEAHSTDAASPAARPLRSRSGPRAPIAGSRAMIDVCPVGRTLRIW